MAIRLSEYSYGQKRRRGEGVRIGCARYLVRGVPQSRYPRLDIMDVWLPTLAPSRELLAWARKSSLDDSRRWKTFLRRYRNEMKQTAQRQTIRTLARLAMATPISIGCYCRSERCHRFALERMIRAAAAGKY